MNDTMSLLLATGILAVGGLGLFMYKSGSDDKEPEEYEPPKRSRGSKTKSTRKSSGTKRRY